VAVVVAGRGALPFNSLLGQPLYAHAIAAVQDWAPCLVIDEGPTQRRAVDADALPAGVAVLSVADWWRQCGPGPLLLHDPLCPLTPRDFLRDMLARAEAAPSVTHVGVRPVTDTLKTVSGQIIEGTIDRDRIATVTSPVVVGAQVLDGAGQPPLDDFAAAVSWARRRGAVELVRAPSVARRVSDESSVHLLESVVELSRQVRRPVTDATAT
jgi:2-C-methyl-D-erythritol 4-phosphate cytidylyltransferase